MAYIPFDENLSTAESDPISQHFVSERVSETDYLDASSPYYMYIDMDGVRYLGIQLSLDCDAGTVTATLDATIQDDGTAPALCDYEDDVTNALVGAFSLVSAAAPATDIWIIDTPLPVKYLRIEIALATGGNTGDFTINVKKLY